MRAAAAFRVVQKEESMFKRAIINGGLGFVFLAAIAVLGLSLGQETRAGFAGITLTPATDTNFVGSSHTVTATVTDFLGDPVSGSPVEFAILSGPNAGDSGTDTTDTSGEATFTYPGDGGTGTDTIGACTFVFVGPQGEVGTETISCLAFCFKFGFDIGANDDVGTFQGPACDTATKTWVGRPAIPTPTPTPTLTPTATPTPTPTPVLGPEALPPTGGQPGGGSNLPWVALAGLAFGGPALLAAGLALHRRTRLP